jgi:hypothetical protein
MALLAAAAAGKPVLYAALAQAVMEELGDGGTPEIGLEGVKGTPLEQLMEVILERDPREFLMECFGKSGLRRLAQKIAPDSARDPTRSSVEVVLEHFGFNVPAPTPDIEGPAQVRQRLRVCACTVNEALTQRDAHGAFHESIRGFERLLRFSLWAWAQRVFGKERDAVLLELLGKTEPNRRHDLSRLTFGQVVALFRDLPDRIAGSDQASLIEQKFGRRHIYLPSDKRKFAARLAEVVTLRNKVEHDKDSYVSRTPLPQFRSDLTACLEEADRLVGELADARALARVAEPIEEIRDKFGKLRYRLCLDDGTSISAGFSTPLIASVFNVHPATIYRLAVN